MGMGRFTPADWDAFTTARTAGRGRAAMFSRGLQPSLDPRRIKHGLRESRDSALNPASTAIIVGLDVTGSMGMVAEGIARDGLKTLFTEVYDRRPVPDPHIMFMGVGDALFDRAPLQVSQFEGDIRIAEQLVDLWLEGGGGGNACESYTLPWYFAAMHTAADCFEKRRRKGYLFTIGDEEPPAVLTKEELARVLGSAGQRDFAARELLDLASRRWEVFHVVAEEGSHCRGVGAGRVVAEWAALLGQRALRLADHARLAEVIVSAIQVNEGADAASVAGSWPGETALVVRRAVGGLTRARPSAGAGPAVVRL